MFMTIHPTDVAYALLDNLGSKEYLKNLLPATPQ